MKTSVQGFYRIEKIKNNDVTFSSDWVKNVITNTGISAGFIGGWCRVGSGITPPSSSDLQLENELSSTNTIETTVSGAELTSNKFGWHRTTYRFPAGAEIRNISEIGVFSTNGSLSSRTVLRDVNNNIIRITKFADEELRVHFELRFVATETTGTINGIGWTARGAQISSWSATHVPSGSNTAFGNSWTANAYSGTIATEEGFPIGIPRVCSLSTSNTSGPSYFEIKYSITIPPTTDDIRTIVLTSLVDPLPTYQIGFDSSIGTNSTTSIKLYITQRIQRQ